MAHIFALSTNLYWLENGAQNGDEVAESRGEREKERKRGRDRTKIERGRGRAS